MPTGLGKRKKAAKPKAKPKAKWQQRHGKSQSSASLVIDARRKARVAETTSQHMTRNMKKPAAAPATQTNNDKPGDSVSVHVSKYRFQYVNSLPVSQLEEGKLYYDRVSLSIPCREVWQKVLADSRFSRMGTFIPLGKLSVSRLRELALFVWKNLSEQGRQHLGEQYWRARAQSFENYVRKQVLEQVDAGPGQGTSKEEDLDRCLVIAPGASLSIPDPEPLTENHRDPYLMSCPGKHMLIGKGKAAKKKAEDKEIAKESTDSEGKGAHTAKNYNALRQSQNVSDSPVQFMNSLRCCYAEIAAPKGALVLLRGNSHNQSGKQVLAEYARSPEEDLDLWREADADEALAGYVDSASGRRVAYPWRQRLIKVICQIPKKVIVDRGSGALRKQLNSGKLMKESDVKMLKEYAKKSRKRQSSTGGNMDMRRDPAKKPSAHKMVENSSPHARGTCVNMVDSASEPKRRRTSASSSDIVPAPCHMNQVSHPSYEALYNLLEKTYFPTGHRVNVAGYEGVSYLIFGLHRGTRRGACANQLELTEATRLAYGKLKPEEVMEDEDNEQARQQKYTQHQVDHYKVLLEFVLRHFKEVGLGLNKGSIHDPLQDKFIPSDRVFFTSVMVAKNKRTFFHRDSNNYGPSFQVVVGDPSKVDNGEFKGGNLLAWPTLEKQEAERRVRELREFWEVRRNIRLARRERMAHVNPVNARWTGEGDKAEIDSTTGEILKPGSSDGHTPDAIEQLLLDKRGGVGLRNLPEETILAARKAVYYGDHGEDDEQQLEEGEPTHDEDATVISCVHKYVSFYGKECFHATQPWTRSLSRYCITFFGIKMDKRHSKLRDELQDIGFKPCPEGMMLDAEDGEQEEQ